MVPAVPEEQYALLKGQVARALAVDMDDTITAEADGVVFPKCLEAPRTLRLAHRRVSVTGVGTEPDATRL